MFKISLLKFFVIILLVIFLTSSVLGFMIYNGQYQIEGSIDNSYKVIANDNKEIRYNLKNIFCNDIDGGVTQENNLYILSLFTPTEPDKSEILCEEDTTYYHWSGNTAPNGCCGDDVPNMSSSSYNDLYYPSSDSDFVCSINKSDDYNPEQMNLNMSGDGSYFSGRNWSWLDAYNEAYIVHNAQLDEDTNVEFVSNDEEFFVCNASGLANDLNFDSGHKVGEFETFPYGSRVGSCPAGTYYCEDAYRSMASPPYGDAPDICGNLNWSGVNFSYPGSGSDEEDLCYVYAGDIFPFYNSEDYYSCVAHECLCQEYHDEGGNCSDFNFESIAGNGTNVPGGLGGGSFEIKSLSGNNYLNDMLTSSGVNIIQENCSNQVDDDSDGFVDCLDADCYDYDDCENITSFDCIDDEGNLLCNYSFCAMSLSNCSGYYSGSGYYVSPKNESFTCYGRSGNSLFTQCCGYDTVCENADYQSNFMNLPRNKAKVDYQTQFLGRGAPLYYINTFDLEKEPYTNYTDRVRYYDSGEASYGDFTMDFRQSPSVSNNYKNLDLTDISDSYYKTLEFDIGFANLSSLNIGFNYTNSSGSGSTFSINSSNFNDYSNNGDQDYRWHHVIIPLGDLNVEIYNKLDVSGTSFAIDNIFLGINKSGKTNPMCAGSFGFWIEEFDPDEALVDDCKDIYPVVEGDNCTACNLINNSQDCQVSARGPFNMSVLADDSNSLGWVEFDPFKLVCDSYLSYGWTGTRCCGDDSDLATKEFYSDYRGACWYGYSVAYNQRIGDVLYDIDDNFNDDKRNELNRFLFYSPAIKDENKFWGCNLRDGSNLINITINDSTVNNGTYQGSSDYNVSFYDSSITGEINVTGVDMCAIRGKYYCNYDDTWSDFVGSLQEDLDWESDMGLYQKADPYNETSGCCPVDYCWNGKKCVAASYYEHNSSRQPLDYFSIIHSPPAHINSQNRNLTKGYRCIVNNSGQAVWENATIKYDWNLNTTGYCKHESYCFVSEDFSPSEILHNDGCCDLGTSGSPLSGELVNETDPNLVGDCLSVNAVDYFNVSDSACELRDCVPPGTTLDDDKNIDTYGKYYCDNGSWSSRSAKVAKNICNWLDCGNDEFSLVCDDELVLNTGNVKDVETVCSYMNHDDDQRMIAYILSNSSYQGLANLLVDSAYKDVYSTKTGCSSVNANVNCSLDHGSKLASDIYNCSSSCVLEDFYYDNKTKTLIVTDFDTINFGLDSASFIEDITDWIYEIFHPSFNPDFHKLTGNTVYDKLFMAHNGDLQVMAAQEYKYDENLGNKVIDKIYINYSEEFNFENILNEYYARALFERKEILDNDLAEDFIFDKCSNDGYALIQNPELSLTIDSKVRDDMIWTYLTKTLRLTGEGDVITSTPTYDLCGYCENESHCLDNTTCNSNSNCVGVENYSGCYFDDQCNDTLLCINNGCSYDNHSNGYVGDDEECDLGDSNGNITAQCYVASMVSNDTCTFCNASAQYEVYTAECGDGYKNADEQCDDNDNNNSDFCLNTCVNASCGDGHIWSVKEDCDNGSLNGDIEAFFDPGSLNQGETDYFCNTSCGDELYNASCGDDYKNADEDCDGSDLGAYQCTDFGFYSGTLSCNSSCNFNVSSCYDECFLDSVSLYSHPPDNPSSEGDIVDISGAISGDCSEASAIQINAVSTDGACYLNFSGSDMQGITNQSLNIDPGSPSFSTSWTVPEIPNICANKNITGVSAKLWEGAPEASSAISEEAISIWGLIELDKNVCTGSPSCSAYTDGLTCVMNGCYWNGLAADQYCSTSCASGSCPCPGYECEYGSCLGNLCSPCVDNSDCMFNSTNHNYDLTCYYGTCVIGEEHFHVGHVCRYDYECMSGVCVGPVVPGDDGYCKELNCSTSPWP